MTAPKDRATASQNGILERLQLIAELGKRLAAEAEELEAHLRASEWDHEGGHAQGTGSGKGLRREKVTRTREPLDPAFHLTLIKMLRQTPMTYAQLLEATGAPANKIKEHLTKMQRDGVNLKKYGPKNKRVYFIADDD